MHVTASYALIALLGVENGRTDEAHVECDDLEQVFRAIRQLVAARGRDWHALSVVHIEDYAKMLAEARSEPSARTTLEGPIA